MHEYSFSVFPNENFLDLRLFQYGWEQCAPLHSFGPFVRNHYLFHYVISGRGVLHSNDAGGITHYYHLGPGQGFLICPGQINTYCADESQPWMYAWVEFDGLRAAEYLDLAGLDVSHPIYRPRDAAGGNRLRDRLLYIAEHPEASPLHLVGQLCLFLDELMTTSSTRRKNWGGQVKDFYIQEAVTYIQQNFQRQLSVEEIAGVCKLNRSYFSKLFKEIIGMSAYTTIYYDAGGGEVSFDKPSTNWYFNGEATAPAGITVLGGKTGILLLCIVWGIAIAGILIKAFWVYCPRWVSSVLYIGMGWTCVLAFTQILNSMSLAAFGWLLAGGVIYTAGGVIYALKLPLFNSKHKYFGSHEIFHLFVMGGSACHFVVMYAFVL